MLAEHYADRAKVEELIALGDISSLGEEIGEKHGFNSDEPEHERWTTAYRRDRGDAERETETETISSRAAYFAHWVCGRRGEEYAYLYDLTGAWLVAHQRPRVTGSFVPLSDVLATMEGMEDDE